MVDSSSHTLVCSVLFVDIPAYSTHPVAEQLQLKRMLNRMISDALKSVETHDRVLLDTGDGAAVTFLGPPEDALFVGLDIREQSHVTAMRMGINLGPVRLLNDLNGQINIVGDGINVAQRVMDFAEPGQLLVSRSFYEVVSRLSKEYGALFSLEGEYEDKHARSHEVYSVVEEAHSGLRTSDTEVRLRTRRDIMSKVVSEVARQTAPVEELPEHELASQPASIFDAGANLIISGYSEASVKAALDELQDQGARALSPVTQVSNKWMATCEHPQARVNACTVTDVGNSRIVTGPTREAVLAKVDELAQFGYKALYGIEQAGGVWTAVCETDR